MTLRIRFYNKPFGDMREIEISNVYPEDEKYVKENNLIISMEEMPGRCEGFIVYCCDSMDKDEENELIEFSDNKSCEDTISAIVNAWKLKNEMNIA